MMYLLRKGEEQMGLKAFKATIKAKTQAGASLNYTCTRPVGLVEEAVTVALLDGASAAEIRDWVNKTLANGNR